MPGGTSTRESSEAIRMEPLGRTSSSRSPGQNGTANTTTEVPINSGDSNTGLHKRSIYEHNGIVCSQKRALCIATVVFAILFAISLIIAFAGPQNDCPCAGEKPAIVDIEDDEKSSEPLATNGEVFPWNNVRLPTFAHPTRYNITIHPNLTTLEVKGQVTIEFYVDRETNYIVFHSKNLTINEKMIQDRKGHRLKISRLLEYPKHQQLYLELEESKFRKRGNYTVHLRFISKLSSELEGFYLSSYVTPEGEKRYLATTHFEPTYARSAFPCFDEPQFKAKFKVSIFRDRFHIALCNMPVMNTEDAGFYMGTGLLRDDFQESVEMSTYLVAFVVCDFKRVSELTKRNISVSVYASEAMLPQARYAVTTAARIMDYFESFFGVHYPLPKQDLIAIPDFGTGAMENWGLITYRETSILYDPEESSTNIHEWIGTIVAHELAHQWFGNLVTMKWWNDLWLNEGAASFFEYKGVNHISPEWSMMDKFILEKTQSALDLDALASSHPISVQVKDPNEIEAIFDNISYNKGASILNMLEGFLCEDVLKSGLNDYLNSHAYGNADTNDLWAAFTKHANNTFDVKAIMDTWTQQMGFPLITITRNGNTITAAQKRFLISPRENDTESQRARSSFDYKWYIPLSYYTDKEPRKLHNVWMNLTDVTFEIPSDVKYIKCNVNQSGFYRVTYPEEMWTSIIATLLNDHTKFSPADRANLIDDAFTLCEAGELNATVPLRLSLYLLNERDYAPWTTALRYLHSWKERLSESPGYKRYISFFKKLLIPVTKYVGWSDEGSHLKKLLRIAVLQSAVSIKLEDVVKPAKSLFDDWMLKGKRIAPNIRNVVYIAGIKFGGEKEWNHCWENYQETQVSSEKLIMLEALGASTDSWLLQRYLLRSLDRDMVKSQDMETVIISVASNSDGQFLVWRHLKAYWPQIHVLLGNGSLSGLISVVVSNFFTEYDYHEVSEFFKKVDVGSGQRALEQSLETIKFNIHWVKENADIVDRWLVNHSNVETS
ncbi:endoplasmic reticulum aminopeptidase 1 isoform X1 [Apis mellifera]|uniref:Endoplasmic reticulum aminopeptidase 1 isoform X1 n=1 Tax=Apis mellifera TaxID=7460 RepID=A0A7M7LQ36_APIME|nr:endoplasmic reticulum aminopeptidase 1 isoform X1 [Apis mellifera]|eukprot:XP_006571773.2 endoplasmic reticulum aminopeptidase 1 isoform X1 [Apis mellifera]